MCSNSSGSRSTRITFCEKRNLRCTLCETTMSGFMCAAPTAIRALPLTGCMTLSTKQQGMDSLYAAHLLTIAAENTLKDRIGLRSMLDAVENATKAQSVPTLFPTHSLPISKFKNLKRFASKSKRIFGISHFKPYFSCVLAIRTNLPSTKSKL